MVCQRQCVTSRFCRFLFRQPNNLIIITFSRHSVIHYRNIADPLSKALDLEEEAVVEKSSFEHNTIYANIGYAFVTSKFYLPPGGSGHPKNGLDWQLLPNNEGFRWSVNANALPPAFAVSCFANQTT